MTPEQRLAELGYDLPPAPKPAGTYVGSVLTGNLLFVSGNGPRRVDGSFATGVVGAELTVEQAYEHARLTALTILSVVKRDLGELSRIKRVVKVFGMVNCTPDFKEHPQAINGCSDLLVEVFGDAGRHARSAVGMCSLPVGISIEIEAVFELDGG
jgi:enamine deaminase RidA (YjgF/YER057c/UK114 family)